MKNNKYLYFCINSLIMTKKNDFIWNAIQTICWLLFAGFCVQTGVFIFNFIYSLYKPIVASNLHLGLNLSSVYNGNFNVYVLLLMLVISITSLKGFVFFYVLRLFKILKLVKPFTGSVSDLINKITLFSFYVGALGFISKKLSEHFRGKGYDLNLVDRYWEDSYAFLMMAAILFVIALIFQKGIELQSENDLTV